MTFIPKRQLKRGTPIALQSPVETSEGTFTEGHILYAVESTKEGWSFVDIDGNVIKNTGFFPSKHYNYKIVALSNDVPDLVDSVLKRFNIKESFKIVISSDNTEKTLS